MRIEDRALIGQLVEVHPERPVWDWCAEHVDFALNPAYPTEYRGHYDPELLPFWKEPLQNVFNPAIREQAILKPSQAGGTENICLNAIRYAVAVSPRRTLYVWGDQKAAEEDFRARILGGLECSQACTARLRTARTIECRVDFADMSIAGAWPKNRMAFKRNPWALIIADEFSTYPNLTPGMIRKRCDTVPFSHIVWISSPDPTMKQSSGDDPIFIEHESGDQRKWMMKDPKTGKLFDFEMGTETSKHGLKWDKKSKLADGSYDWDLVRKSAHYITPSGTKITESKRMGIVRKGQWVPTNKHAAAWRRSYHMNAFCMPFKSGEFGKIAEEFLRAKHGGPQQLKVFVYEYLAEKWTHTTETTKDDALYDRREQYEKGTLISASDDFAEIYVPKPRAVFVTADMQKGHHWWVAREWIEGGDSGLVDWGYGVILEDLREKEQALQASQVFIDNGYAERKMEVYEASYEWQWMPTIGSEQLSLPYKSQQVDPFEGKHGQGAMSLMQLTFNTDIFKSILLDLIRGQGSRAWSLYRKIEERYIAQVASEERVDGEWRKKRGHPDNHLWDCEVLQLLCATVEGLYRNEWNVG